MKILTIQEIIRKAEQDWVRGWTTHSEYVRFSIYETLNRIDAYLNSKHITGDMDALGRDKPFFNIVTAAVNIWYRATDIDRKNIVIRATKESDTVGAFIASLLLQKYMRKSNFGVFLNEWGRTLARYGSAVTKFVEKNGELISEVIPWNRIICDAIDFSSSPVIEKFWLNPAQLQKRINDNGYDKDFVEQIIEKHSFTTRTLMGLRTQDTKADYIPIYEIHGELPLSLITDSEDDDETYQQQMHVVCFIEKNEKTQTGETAFEDYTLYRGKEKQNPYMITHLIKEDGQTLSIGAVQHLFEAQWMVNHSQKQIKDQLDLASKLIFQTADGNFLGKNALSNIENGQVLVYTQGNPLTQVANNSHDITASQSFQGQWQAVGNQINGISEAMQGANPPSGTAWRLQQAVLQESHSLFELMTENKGLAIIEMITKYILPYFKKQMDITEEISEILSESQVKFIDSKFVPNQAIRNLEAKKRHVILSGKIYNPANEPADLASEQSNIQQGLSQQGNQRFIKPSEIDSVTWKDNLKDLEWNLDIDVTGESKDIQSAMATLSTVFQTIAGLQGQPMSPELKMVFDKILSLTGSVSPLELFQLPKPHIMPQMAPVGVGQQMPMMANQQNATNQ